MTPDEETKLGALVLQRGKMLAADRFPKPSPQAAQAWGRILGAVAVPAEMWPEAVDLWAAEMVGERMCTPRELLAAVREVRGRWERDPQRRVVLQAHRRARRDARDAALEAGTLGQVRTMPPLGAVHWPQETPPTTAGPQRQLGGGQ